MRRREGPSPRRSFCASVCLTWCRAMLSRLALGPRVSRTVLGLRLPGVHANAPPALSHAVRHLFAGPSAPAARDLEAAATGGGDPAVAQLLEEYVVGWAAGSIRRYRQTPHPPGTLPGLSRWCRTLRHDIMKDLCQPAPAKASTPRPARRKVKNSAFKKAEHYRLLCNGESWRASQKKKNVARKKWAKAMDEPPLLTFLSRLAAEGKLGDAETPLRRGVAARLEAQAERRARPPPTRGEVFWSAHAERASEKEARGRERQAGWARYQFKLRKQGERREARARERGSAGFGVPVSGAGGAPASAPPAAESVSRAAWQEGWVH
jgi:hypothetical protein